MRKHILAALLALCLALLLCITVCAQTEYVTDEAGLLSDTETERLEALAAKISEQYRCGLYIAVVEDFRDYGGSVYEAAKSFYRQNTLGWGEEKNGVLLLLSMEERDYSLISNGKFGNAAFTDHGKDVLAEAFLDAFGDDGWYDGFSDYLEKSAEFLRMARAGEPFDLDTDPDAKRTDIILSLAIVVCFPCVLAGAVCLFLKWKMRSVRTAADADVYLTESGVELRESSDIFTHTTETRVKIEEKSSGGTTIDLDGFSGKSGKF